MNRRPIPAPISTLENRLHLTVTQDANGYTVVTPSADSRVIYVSTSGSDSNSGLSPSAPLATIVKGMAMMRSGYPDELLLRRGDVFHQYFNNWYVSGRSVQEPALVGAYGTGARPEIDCGSVTAAFLSTNGEAVSYVDVIGIGFDPLARDPTSSLFNPSAVGGTTGFRWYVPGGGNVLVEDCSFSYFRNDIDIEDGSSNITIRRCIVTNSYSTNSHSQGMYADAVSNITVEQCLFDHDGWNTVVPGAGQQGYNHDMYFSAQTRGMTVQDNVIADASFCGINARSGGDIDDNLFVNDPIAVNFGDANGANSTPGGVVGSLLDNVIAGTGSVNGSPYGQGMEIGNTEPGAGLLVSGNVFSDTLQAGPALTLTMATNTLTPAVCVGDNDVTITNNIIDGFSYSFQIDGRFVPGGTGLYGLTDLKIDDNDLLNASKCLARDDGAVDPTQEQFAGNRYYDPSLDPLQWARVQTVPIGITPWLSAYDTAGTVLPAVPYTDPTRTSATYDAAVGGPGTAADFMAQAALMSPTNYRAQYTAQAVINYIKTGFAVDTAPPTATATSLPQVTAANPAGTISVTYADAYTLNPATIRTGDLLVTGPNGFTYTPTLIGTTPVSTTPAGQQVTATYAVAPTAWATGTYAVTLVGGTVADGSGNTMAAAPLGTFAVDVTPPTIAAVVAAAVTTANPAAPLYTFTVTYADPSGIDLTSLDSNQIQVASPNGFAQTAGLLSVASTATTATATYAIVPPAGGWTGANDGTYTITLAGDPVRDTLGNALTSAAVGAFTVGIVTTPTTVTVSGYAYVDANGNGQFDPREVGLGGATVFLDVAGTGVYAAGDPMTTTAADGSYSFAGLAAGTYKVVIVPPSGYSLTTAASQTVAATANVSAVDFGLQVTLTRTNGTPTRKPKPVIGTVVTSAPPTSGVVPTTTTTPTTVSA